jgi:hypothetical protein
LIILLFKIAVSFKNINFIDISKKILFLLVPNSLFKLSYNINSKAFTFFNLKLKFNYWEPPWGPCGVIVVPKRPDCFAVQVKATGRFTALIPAAVARLRIASQLPPRGPAGWLQSPAASTSDAKQPISAAVARLRIASQSLVGWLQSNQRPDCFAVQVKATSDPEVMPT